MKSLTKQDGLAVLSLLFFTPLALAAGGLETEVTGMMETIRTSIYAIVGVLATIALLWQCAQGFMGRKTWGDVFEAMLWIFGAGAAIAFATWLFTKGGSISF